MIKLNQPDGSQIDLQAWLYSGFTASFSPVNASLAWAVTFILFWLVILWVMYIKKIIIKV
jgi:predicted acyltransferase